MKPSGVLESRAAPWCVLAIAFALGLTTIQLGFYNDDYAILAALDGAWPNGPPAWDLYRFTYDSAEANRVAIESGALPWWTVPTIKIHLLRPLASLGFLVDAKIFGTSSPVGWHLHSIAWYVLLVYLVGVVLRAVLPRATATLAMFVYAVNTAHLYPYGWIACRHMVVAAVFGAFGFVALLRDPRRGPSLFALGLAASLASSETGIGVAVFGIVWIVAKTRREELLPKLVPTGTVLLAWLAAYVALGGGAAHSDGYVAPTSAPARFAQKAAVMLPVAIGNAILGVPAELASVMPPAPLVIVGIVAAIFIVAMWRGAAAAMPDEERGALRWLGVASVLAIVPSLGGFPGARILLVPNVGFAALVAVLIRHGFARTSTGGAVARGGRAAGTVLLVLVHVVLAPVVDVGNAAFNARVGRQLEAISANVALEIDPKSRGRLFIVGASDPLVTMYPPIVVAATSIEQRLRFPCWSVLSGSKQALEMTRTADNEIVVRPTSGPLLRGPFEALYRSTSDPFRAGDEVRQCGALYRVSAVEDGRPTELRLTFDVSLDDPSLRMLHWNGTRLVRFAMPRVGESAPVSWSPGPLGMF